jgi:hypothetical protein
MDRRRTMFAEVQSGRHRKLGVLARIDPVADDSPASGDSRLRHSTVLPLLGL